MKVSKQIMEIFMDKIPFFEIGNEKIMTLGGFIGLPDSSDTIIVTNKSMYYGALEIFNPNVIKKLIDMKKGSFYILPSSIHEVLILPHNTDMDLDYLLHTLENINATLEKEIVLGDFVMEYDANRNELLIANGKL